MKKQVSFQEPIVVTQSYEVSSQRRLVPLNPDFSNFRMLFKVSSSGGIPFNAIVVDQKTLDTESVIDMRVVDTELSGQIVSDDDPTERYYLMLSSDSPTIVDVELHITHVPPTTPQTPVEKKPILKKPVKPTTPKHVVVQESKPDNSILIIVGIIITCGLLYFIFNRPKTESKNVFQKHSILDKLRPV